MISNLSIRKQLLLLVIAVILPVMAALAYAIYGAARQRLAEVESEVRLLAVVAAADVSRVLATNRDMLMQMAERPLIRAIDAQHCDPVLWDFHSIFPRSANLATVDLRGEAICSAVPQPGGRHVMVDDAPWFRRALTEGGWAVGDPFFGPITGRWVTVLTYPIRDEERRRVGFLALPLDLALYRPNLSGAPLRPDTTVGVVTGKGVFVWRNLETERWVGQDGSVMAPVREGLARKSGEYTSVGPDGIERIYSIVPVEGADWYVYVGVPARAVYSQFNASFARNGVVGLLVLAGVLGFALSVARRIERPIQALAAVARSVREGRRETRAARTGPPEILEVATELNEMLDARLRAESALIESERNLKDILVNLPAGVMVYGGDAAIRFVNPAAAELLGSSAAQLLGRTSRELDWPLIRSDGSRMPVEEYPTSRAMAERRPVHDSTVGIRAEDGAAPRWVSVSAFPDYHADGSLRQVIVCFVDITERRNLEAAVQREASDWTQAMDAFADAIYLLDAERRLVRANKRFYALAGTDPAGSVGRHIQALLHPGDDAFDCPVCAAQEQKRDAIVTLEADHPDNPAALPLEVTVKIIRDGLGNPTGILTVLHDLSRARKIERELHLLNETLEARVAEEVRKNREKDHLLIQQSRLAAMGEMVHNIAHQWRQPLNALAILLANIRDAYAFNELTAESLDEEIARGDRLIGGMSRTIDDFRNFFAPDKEKTRFSLKEAVEEALSIVSASLTASHITVRLEVAEEVQGYGYLNEFAQAVLNIVSNAKEAMLERGVRSGNVDIRVFAADGRAAVSIRDDAGGIPEGVMAKIFEPYFTTKEKGSGIGLYMAKMIVEGSMGGTIEVHRIEGGTEFVLTCPRG